MRSNIKMRSSDLPCANHAFAVAADAGVECLARKHGEHILGAANLAVTHVARANNGPGQLGQLRRRCAGARWPPLEHALHKRLKRDLAVD